MNYMPDPSLLALLEQLQRPKPAIVREMPPRASFVALKDWSDRQLDEMEAGSQSYACDVDKRCGTIWAMFAKHSASDIDLSPYLFQLSISISETQRYVIDGTKDYKRSEKLRRIMLDRAKKNSSAEYRYVKASVARARASEATLYLADFNMLLSLKALFAKYDPSGQSRQSAEGPTNVGEHLRRLAA